jgi:hypothetical protein
MTDTIEFFKRYARQSRSPWDDVSRVVMMFQPDSKQGIYLHLGESGINGVSLSKDLQSRLPKALQSQYIEASDIEVVLHVFEEEISDYCNCNVTTDAFKRIFLVGQRGFFSDESKAVWKKSYQQFLASL